MMGPWPSWPRPPLAPGLREPVPVQAACRRLSFTGARSKAIWEPRLAALGRAALATELHLVASDALKAALVWCPYEALPTFIEQLRTKSLVWATGPAVLRSYEPPAGGLPAPDPLTRMTYSFVVAATKAEADRFVADDAALETALAFGHPRCCAEAWLRALEDGASDPIAVLAGDPAWDGHSDATGTMLAALGLGPVRHMPCRPGCDAARESALRFLAAMKALGFESEAGWLEDMVQWRAKASIVGGIAEVETGAFRFAWQAADPGQSGRAVAGGSNAPEGSPAGLSAIFARPEMPIRAQPRHFAPPDSAIAEGFAEAGFDSAFAMRSRWSCVIWEQSKALRRSRTALHLGCGSGLLLELLVHSRPSLRVCGIEADPSLASLARERMESVNGAAIFEADWIAEAGLPREAGIRFDLAFLDPEPLIDRGPVDRTAILEGLGALAGTAILIASDRALRRFGSIESMAAMLGLDLEPGRDRRISSPIANAFPALAIA